MARMLVAAVVAVGSGVLVAARPAPTRARSAR